MSDFMNDLNEQAKVPKLERIKKRPDYLAVASSRRKWVTPNFIIQYKPAKGDQKSDQKSDRRARVGFTVTKKVGNAVVRNRCKRRLKEVARDAFAELGKVGCDYVIIGRSGSFNAPFEKLIKDMRWALEKLGDDADLNTSSKKPQKSPNKAETK